MAVKAKSSRSSTKARNGTPTVSVFRTSAKMARTLGLRPNVMQGYVPKTTCPSLTRCQMMTPQIGLNLGFDRKKRTPVPPPVAQDIVTIGDAQNITTIGGLDNLVTIT